MSEISLRERFFTVRDDNVRPFVHAWLTATFTAPCLVLLPFIIADGDGVLAALILPLLVLPWGAVISAPLAFAALVAVAPLYWLLKGRGVSRMATIAIATLVGAIVLGGAIAASGAATGLSIEWTMPPNPDTISALLGGALTRALSGWVFWRAYAGAHRER